MSTFEFTAERLRIEFHFDPLSGLFTRLEQSIFRSGRDKTVGCVGDRGYLKITIGRRTYLAHRLAWMYIHGCWPSGVIDHINGVKTDNRLENLRDVSQSTNTQNRKAAKLTATSGFMGVSKVTGSNTWRASIKVDGKYLYMGGFKTPESAHDAYLNAKRKHHEGCTI